MVIEFVTMRGHCQLRSVPCYLFCKNSVASYCSHFYSIYPERNSVQWSKWSTLCSGKTGKTSLQVDVYRRKFYESKFHLLVLRKTLKALNEVFISCTQWGPSTEMFDCTSPKSHISLSLHPSWAWFLRAIWEAVSWAISETQLSVLSSVDIW